MAYVEYQGDAGQMYAKQRAAIDDPHRISVIEAGTKTGKTVGCLEWVLRRALAGGVGEDPLVGGPGVRAGRDRVPAYATPVEADPQRLQVQPDQHDHHPPQRGQDGV